MPSEASLETIVLEKAPRSVRILNIMNKMLSTPERIARNTHRLPKMHELLTQEYELLTKKTESLSAELTTKDLELTQAKEESFIDSLTGARNQRAYQKDGIEQLDQAKRLGEGLTIIYFDLDHFKRINDRYGHPVGDYVLKTFTKAAQESLRIGASFYRIGGEEFAIIARTKNNEAPMAAQTIAERVQERYAELMGTEDIPQEIINDLNKPTFSASAGFACYSKDVQHVLNYASKPTEELFKILYTKADKNLYHAKNTNRGSIIGTDLIVEFAA